MISITNSAVKICIISSVFVLSACGDFQSNGKKLSANEEIALSDMLVQIKDNLVFVEGGEYLMGDFGRTHTPDGLPFTNEYTTPVHDVILDDFYISKFKVTNDEYQLYARLNDIDINEGISKYGAIEFARANSIPILPAHMFWSQADKYCAWLAEKTGLAFSLPTEAQWEYAARSRGQMIPYATDTGWAMPGINMPAEAEKFLYSARYETRLYESQALPGDYYPPNALGVYDMTNNGYEWVSDWFDPDYYAISPKYNPKGPKELNFESPKLSQKTLRSSANDFLSIAVFLRKGGNLDPYKEGVKNKTARCVVNQSALADK